MASHQLAIAKATFAASLLRPDSTFKSVARDQVSHFHTLLDATIVQCSPANVQATREWLRDNIVPSSARSAAFGKFLTALSASCTPSDKRPQGKRTTTAPRKRLHILYLISDVLHWSKFHDTNGHATYQAFAVSVETHLPALFTSAASFEPAKNRKHHNRIIDLLKIWEDSGYYSTDSLRRLNHAVEIAGATNPTDDNVDLTGGAVDSLSSVPRRGKDVPYKMPSTHGDPFAPYYDLPAANMMPHIVPNSSSPINPQLMKPIQFVPDRADDKLADAVRGFLADVERIYDGTVHEDEGIVPDIDDMGQPVILDEMGDRVGGETYYGWSRAFCEKMRRRRLGSPDHKGDNRGWSRSSSWSGRHGSPRQNRRSLSGSHSRSRSPRRRRRRSNASSRSTSRSRSRHAYRSRLDSRSPPRAFNNAAGSSPTASYQPPSAPPPLPINSQISPLPPSVPQNSPPIPPPRPPHWNGPWPPPPPPPPTAFNSQFGGFPPPPPPPSFLQTRQPLYNPQGQYPGGHVSPPPNPMMGNWNIQGFPHNSSSFPQPPQAFQQNSQGFQQGWNQGGYSGQRGRGRGR